LQNHFKEGVCKNRNAEKNTKQKDDFTLKVSKFKCAYTFGFAFALH
jgi:hypothetical protein